MNKNLNKKPIYNLPANTVSLGKQGMEGFSLIELICSMVLTLIILGIAVTTFSSALGSRERESSKTDAITSTQAALNIMSREIGNAGYGLSTNGIYVNPITGVSDSTNKILHIRSNIVNNDSTTDDPGEDITFYFDNASQSVVRYDANLPSGTIKTSGIINRISDVDFTYYNYNPVTGAVAEGAASANTGRVKITLEVTLPPVQGQPPGQSVRIISDVTLRNNTYLLNKY